MSMTENARLRPIGREPLVMVVLSAQKPVADARDASLDLRAVPRGPANFTNQARLIPVSFRHQLLPSNYGY